jgi:Flp pilus assembly protein TadG
MRSFGRSFLRPPARWRLCGTEAGSQIAEFAVSLPLLVLFVIGIFDFSSAITLKQKLTNAVREGARMAAADPANDLGNTTPPPASVVDAFWVVDNYLLSEQINDCGLKTALPVTSGTLIWTSTAAGCLGGGSNSLVLTINRGYVAQQTSGQNTSFAVGTQVTIRYPYAWQFGGVSGLFGGRFTGTSGITTAAVAFNEN